MSPTESAPTWLAKASATADDSKAVCVRNILGKADGDLPEFEALIHPEAANREAVRAPAASRGKGPAAFYATALWPVGFRLARDTWFAWPSPNGGRGLQQMADDSSHLVHSACDRGSQGGVC